MAVVSGHESEKVLPPPHVKYLSPPGWAGHDLHGLCSRLTLAQVA